LRTARIWPDSEPHCPARGTRAPAEKPTAYALGPWPRPCTQSWPFARQLEERAEHHPRRRRKQRLKRRLASTSAAGYAPRARQIAIEASRQRARDAADYCPPIRTPSSRPLCSSTRRPSSISACSCPTCPPGSRRRRAPWCIIPADESTHGTIRMVHLPRATWAIRMAAGNVLNPFPSPWFDKNPNAMSKPDRGRLAEGRLAAGGARAGAEIV